MFQHNILDEVLGDPLGRTIREYEINFHINIRDQAGLNRPLPLHPEDR